MFCDTFHAVVVFSFFTFCYFARKCCVLCLSLRLVNIARKTESKNKTMPCFKRNQTHVNQIELNWIETRNVRSVFLMWRARKTQTSRFIFERVLCFELCLRGSSNGCCLHKKHIFQWVSDYICSTIDRLNMLTTFNDFYAILVRFSSLIRRFHLKNYVYLQTKCYIDRCTSLDLLTRVSLGQNSKVSHIKPKFQMKKKLSAKCYFLFFGKFMCQFWHLLHGYPLFSQRRDSSVFTNTSFDCVNIGKPPMNTWTLLQF